MLKEAFLKLKVSKFKIVAITIGLSLISQSIFANAPQSQQYIPLEASNVLSLLSHSDVNKIRDMEPYKELNITIVFRLRNKNELKQGIERSHSKKIYGKIIRDQDMENHFLPDKDGHKKVFEFLKSKGLVITKTFNSRLAIHAKGTVYDIEKAFNIKLSYYSYKGNQFFANSTQVQLPSDVVRFVESVEGLNNFKLKTASLKLKPITSNSLNSLPYTPSQIQKAYNLTPAYGNNINGAGIKVAIATYHSFNQTDITYFLNTFGITGAKPINVIPIDGVPLYDQGGSEETTLDIECVISSAPGAQLLVYEGAEENAATGIDIFTQIVDDNQATVVSYSWGQDEANYSKATINAMDNLLMAGAAKGITFLVASGDNGSHVISYPATDPYVTAVGGTSLHLYSSSQISSESAWSDRGDGNASGGGISAIFATPTWQQGKAISNGGYRMIPDVALEADPYSGYLIYYDGIWSTIGGTSAAAPEWAGIFALVNQMRLSKGIGPIGLANTELYSLEIESVFHDITTGSNGQYACLPGYDMVTGLGSVDAWKLINALAKNNIGNLANGSTNKYTTVRLQGINRYETANAIAEAYSQNKVNNIVIATGHNFPNALNAGILAKILNAPILLVEGENNVIVKTFITNHLNLGGNVYILGGLGAVSQKYADSLGVNIIRIQGTDRYETNININKELNLLLGTPIIVATGEDFPDALSMSSISAIKGYPIILVNKDSINPVTSDYILALKPSKIFIVGGIGAIGDKVKASLTSIAGLNMDGVTRISGGNRYATSLAVVNFFNLDTTNLTVATGESFPDALAGSVLGYKLNAPMLLVSDKYNIEQANYLANNSKINTVYVYGGTGAISNNTVNVLENTQ